MYKGPTWVRQGFDRGEKYTHFRSPEPAHLGLLHVSRSRQKGNREVRARIGGVLGVEAAFSASHHLTLAMACCAKQGSSRSLSAAMDNQESYCAVHLELLVRRRWSNLEEVRLRAWKRENKSESWIASKLNRTVSAVKQQWRTMSEERSEY